MNCKQIVLIGVCLLFLVGVSMVRTGECQETKGNETTATAPAPQGTAPANPAAPSDDKAKEKEKAQTDTSAKPAEKKRSYEGC